MYSSFDGVELAYGIVSPLGKHVAMPLVLVKVSCQRFVLSLSFPDLFSRCPLPTCLADLPGRKIIPEPSISQIPLSS